MAASKLLVVIAVLSAIFFTTITAEPPLRDDGASSFLEVEDHSPIRLQLRLRQLETDVYLLKSSLLKNKRELREKDEKIRQMEEIIQGKSNSNPFLQSKSDDVQGKESLVAMEFTDELFVETAEELLKVGDDIILQHKKKDELDERASVAEQKIQELKLKVENAQGEWLSVLRSAADDLRHFQSYVMTYWNERGRPPLYVLSEKALELKAQLKSSAQTSIQIIKSKWVPGLKKQCLEIVAYLEPNIQLLTEKTIDIYHSSKSSVAPIIFKAQEMLDPQIQVAKKCTEPYITHIKMVIDEATWVTRIHVANIHVTLKPYTKKVLHTCTTFIRSAAFYHHKVQEMLKNNKLTQSLATIELAWLVATALLALPAVAMFKLSSAIFRGKPKKRIHSSQANHTRRKLKRAHPDN